jgi:dTDP-4-dehydrorhamnose 3,5-epimerase
MKITPTALPEVLLIEPKVFGDERGFFYESWNQAKFNELIPGDWNFVQDNHSKSARGVLRGLHYQLQHAQGKLVRAVAGEVLDVVLDVRRSSKTFGRWVGVRLSAQNHHQLWVPPGFAHGFVVLSETAEFLYKTTDYWHQASERSVRWNDPELAIDWQIEVTPTLAAKDAQAPLFRDAEVYP